MEVGMPDVKRNLLQRILGQCATPEPRDKECWSYAPPYARVELGKAPEVARRGGAVRLEGHGLPKRVLLVHGADGRFRAFVNHCGHGGRRLDPVPESSEVQCCSIGKSTFDYDGRLLRGASKKDADLLPVEVRDGYLQILIQ